jgi:hypothetical protein
LARYESIIGFLKTIQPPKDLISILSRADVLRPPGELVERLLLRDTDGREVGFGRVLHDEIDGAGLDHFDLWIADRLAGAVEEPHRQLAGSELGDWVTHIDEIDSAHLAGSERQKGVELAAIDDERLGDG